MKILHVIRSMDPARGGMAAGIRQISPYLNALEITSSVISLDPPDSNWLTSRDYTCHGLGPVFGEYGYSRSLPSRIFRLASLHDITIIHGIWHYHAFATWRALHTSNIPYLIYPHGMLDPWFKTTYPLKHIKKWCYWPWADYRVLRDARAVLFTSKTECLLARNSFSLYSAKEVVVGFGSSPPPCNIDNLRSNFLCCFPRLRDKRLIIYLGRIHPKKGLDILIHAFARFSTADPSYQLVVAGPDVVDLKGSLEKLSSDLDISDRITWTGMLNDDQKWGALRSSELFCLPSYQENFGVSVAEALSCGLPVAISRAVNISTDIEDSQAGLVFDATSNDIVTSLLNWHTMNNEQKLDMARNARKLFHNKFTMSSAADRLRSVLASVKLDFLSSTT